MLEDALARLELGFFELGEAFKGLADENVWKRPHPALLSIGELAGHLAYWEAARMTHEGPAAGASRDVSSYLISSPLVDERFSYYGTTLATAPSEEHRSMGADQVFQEVLRVHQASVAHLRAAAPDLKDPVPFWHSNLGDYLEYAAFHTAYHTGQMYSVRHLLGETPPDN